MLTAILAAGWAWLRRPERQDVLPGPLAIAKLGARNTSRNPTRSLLTASVLASAAFLLVAVESFRRSPESDFLKSTGGSGGFALLAQTDLPLYQDPSAPEGRAEILDALEKRWLKQSQSPQQIQQKLADAKNTLIGATIIPLRRQAGDDASCLNLYQPGPPANGRCSASADRSRRISIFRQRRIEGKSMALLETMREDGAIPAIGEANTVQWMLKSSLGGTIAVRDEQGREVRLRIVALLQDSVFQGELLVADSAFHSLYPRRRGLLNS